MALDYVVTHKYEKVDLPEKVFKDIIDHAAWLKQPTFVTQGRTAWYKLDNPIASAGYANLKLRAVKMKGIGVWNPEGRHADEKLEKPIPPTDKIYGREGPHFGFNANGKIVKIHSEDAPYGGICHNRAVMEYENALRLFEANVPSIVPLAVIKYPGLSFNNREMGAVLSLCPGEEPCRFLYLGWEDKYIDKQSREFYNKVKERLGINGDLSDVNVKLQMSVKLAEQFGRAVRGFSEAGLYIHSGGWENMQFDMDNGQIYLTDLDSSRDQKQLPERMRALQALRDFVSNIYRYVNKVYYPKAIKLYNLDNLMEYDVIYYLIKGYMPEISDNQIKSAARKIWRFFTPYLLIMKKNEEKLDTIPKPVRKSFKFDIDDLYILCLHLLYPLFLQTKSSTICEDVFSYEELKQSSREYLKDNYKYIEMLLE